MTEETEAGTPTPAPPAPSPGRAYLAERDRTMNLQGRAYLQVADRVYAFRLDHPITSGWQIITELIAGGYEEKWVIWEARIIDPNGLVVSTAHKQEEPPPANSRGCADWVDKGETGAIGRALGNCGYGTLAALDEDPNSPCDAPRDRGPQRPAPRPAAAPARPAAPAAKPAAATEAAPPCAVCGKPVDNSGRVKYCLSQEKPVSHAEPACSQDPKAQKGGVK